MSQLEHIEAIETRLWSAADNLRGILPKSEYQELNNDVLGQLLRTLNPEELKSVKCATSSKPTEIFTAGNQKRILYHSGENERPLKTKEFDSAVGVNFTWEDDSTSTIFARHIVTDYSWKISLDRGRDIFQHYEMNDAFTFTNRLQQSRPCKAFKVTFIKTGGVSNGD